MQICDRFLKVATLVLQWDFNTAVTSAYRSSNSLYSVNSAMQLRPPQSWNVVFQDENLIPFFFQLHRSVRDNVELAQQSMACIVQLACVAGSVFDRSPRGGKTRSAGQPNPHDVYVQRYCRFMIDTFNKSVFEAAGGLAINASRQFPVATPMKSANSRRLFIVSSFTIRCRFSSAFQSNLWKNSSNSSFTGQRRLHRQRCNR